MLTPHLPPSALLFPPSFKGSNKKPLQNCCFYKSKHTHVIIVFPFFVKRGNLEDLELVSYDKLMEQLDVVKFTAQDMIWKYCFCLFAQTCIALLFQEQTKLKTFTNFVNFDRPHNFCSPPQYVCPCKERLI